MSDIVQAYHHIMKLLEDIKKEDAITRMTQLIITYMLCKGKEAISIERVLIPRKNDPLLVGYVRTEDNEFYRIEVVWDKFLRLKEKKFLNEKEYYESMQAEEKNIL